KWYEQYPLLEYSIKLNVVLCFACRFFTNCSEPTFTSVGFKDWKHATGQKGILTTHSIGNYYTQAMAAWKDYEKRVATAESIGCQLDRMGSKVISDNRKYVKAVMECILHCVLQGIALHMKERSPQAVYIHCCAHRLNLVLVDVAKRNRAASDFFSHLQALYVFLLPKAMNCSFQIRMLLKTLEDVSNGNDRDRAIEAVGILNGVNLFDFTVSLVFKKIFSVSANLSNVLQSKSIDIIAASCLTQSTIDTFNGLRSDEYWGLIWEEI
uniref:TTF-type domain-containing protein n=2 Tax=Amphimedon queenslandica TaxID=400682 RepID=A0A1X7UQ04_AMPQE